MRTHTASRFVLMTGTFCLGVSVLVGCAATRVRKDPGPHDHGVRFYRPKPYLLIQPDATATDPNQVRITLDYLPDYGEEYSIHVRAGLGTNKTKITLDKGWNLTALDVDVDSKVADNINAVANLLKAIPQSPGVAGGPPADTKAQPAVSMQVSAYNVPIGYYEAVVSKDADGTKRLYGWRYVGFAPFAQCPLNGSGSQCLTCTDADLFGLVTVGNKLYFRRLSEMAGQPEAVTAVAKTPPSKVGGDKDPADKK